MSLVHVYKHGEGRRHRLRHGHECRCEPSVINVGIDDAGHPARVFVHQQLNRALPMEPRLSAEGVKELTEGLEP